MKDQELYGEILGIKTPWHVERVELDKKGLEVRVHVENAQRRLPCPTCGEACGRYDTRPRRWRHLDTCQYRTILVALVPRVECEEHGVLQVEVPWSEPGSRFTALFEALVISWLQEASVAAVARQMNLSWGVVYGVLERAVERGLERREQRLPRRLGVDETSFQKRHEYVTVVVDQEEGTVVHVADGRGRDALDDFLEDFSEKELEQVESVAMDMWPAYIGSVTAKIPGAADKIAFDKFHVAQHLSKAVDKVRREENRSLLADGDEQLKGTKYLWLFNPENLSTQRWQDFKSLRASSLKTARAWAIKELAMTLWQYCRRGWATKAWTKWYQWAIRSQLEPVREVARMIKRHLRGIVNAIVLGITNARSEGMNSRIQWVKYMARGYRNRDRFRHAIYFHLGGLDLYPAAVKK
jgi:transposase